MQKLFEQATRWKPNGLLFADERDRCTGAEAAAAVARVGGGLAAAGVGEGDRVAFLAGSSVQHALAFFACLRLGAVACALHVRDTVPSLAASLDRLEPRAVVADCDHLELAAATAEAAT